MAAVFALIFAVEIDPNALLERVASHYSAMKTFALEVRQNGMFGPQLGATGTTKIRLEVGAENRFYFRETRDIVHSDTSPPPLVIVGDGQEIWLDDGRSPGPVQEEAGLRSDRRVREVIHALHRRFAMLDGPAMLARYLKSEKVRGRQCAVIEIESRVAEAPAKWKERLWIEPESATILRSHFESTRNEDGRAEVTHREYIVPPGEREPDESLFSSTPAGRRRR